MSNVIYPFCGIPSSVIDAINARLEALIDIVKIDCAMVVDHSGYLIARKGRIEYLPMEDLATIAAGAFASYALSLKVNEMSADFHTKGVCGQYCLSVNSQMFILAVYQEEVCQDKLRAEVKSAAAAIRNALGKSDSLTLKLGSFNFISEKLDELFKES